MKMRKILALFLSIINLNLSTSIIKCFGMYNEDSITEIVVPELQDDYEYCLNCGGQRTSKLRESGMYSTVCQACGTCVKKLKPHAITHKNRNIQYKKINDILKACKFCGCQRKSYVGKKDDPRKNGMFRCLNCGKNGTEHNLFEDYITQTWKEGFCECNKLSGLIIDFRTLIKKDPQTMKKISKKNVIKDILNDPNGFKYYCYNCDKVNHVKLTLVQRERACSNYNRHFSHPGVFTESYETINEDLFQEDDEKTKRILSFFKGN